MRHLVLTIYYIFMIFFGSFLITLGHMFGYPQGAIPFVIFMIPFGYLTKVGHAKINVWFLARQVKTY